MRHRNRREKKVVEADVDDEDDYSSDEDESSTRTTTFRSSSLFTNTATLPTITSSTRTNSSSRTITTPPLVSTRTSTVIILTKSPSTIVVEASDVLHGATATAAAAAAAAAAPTTSLSASDGVGLPQGNDTEAEADHRGVSGASIAVGTLGGVALLVSVIILLWKWRKQVFARVFKRRNNGQGTDHDDPQSNYTRPNTTIQRRATHRSDDRIMNEVITAVYSAENAIGIRSEKQDADPFNDTNRLVEEGQAPPPPPPNPATKPNSKLNRSFSRWLSRHNSQMLNPMSARASMASDDGGLKALTADWVSDDGTVTDDSFSFHPLTPPKHQEADLYQNDIVPVSKEDRSSNRKTLPAEPVSRPPPSARASQVAPTVITSRTWAHGIRDNEMAPR